MFYIIQKDLYQDIHEIKLIQALERLELEYENIRFIEFEGNRIFEFNTKRKDVFCFGSIKMAHSAKKYGFIPGSMYNDNHDFECYGSIYGDYMLNSDAIIMNFNDPLPDNFPYVFFGRPTGDTKSFSGRIFTKEAWLESVELRKGSTRVLISVLKEIKWEVRCWVVDGKVITTSRYKLGNRIAYLNMDYEDYITEFAQKMVDIYCPADAFVIDICDIGEKELKIVEINCINCAGWYDANISKVLNALEEKFNK